MKIIRVFDDVYCLSNVIVPLSLDADEVTYLEHHSVPDSQKRSVNKVLNRYKKMNINHITVKDINDVEALLDKNKDAIVDVGSRRYGSLLLFEKAINKQHKIIYYDDEENNIKAYRDHRVIQDKIFSFSIEDIVNLGGGHIQSVMHKVPKDSDHVTTPLVKKVVETYLKKYSVLVNFVSKINNLLCKTTSQDGLKFFVGKETASKLLNDENFREFQELGLLKLEGDFIVFPTRTIAKMFNVSGSFLELYLYDELVSSKLFDDVMMSAVIDFTVETKKYPVKCEIDCVLIRNNKLCFMSCKSNKVTTADLNEIKVHDVIFGNSSSHAAVVTLEDLNIHSPSVYLKARELNVGVIDQTSFIRHSIPEDVLAIVEETYTYEKIIG